MAAPIFVADEVVTAAKMNSLPKGILAVVEKTTSQGSITVETTISSLSISPTFAADRAIYLEFAAHATNTVASTVTVRIKDSTTTVLEAVVSGISGINTRITCDGWLLSPSAGAHTLTVTVTPTAGTLSVNADTVRIARLSATDKGAN